MFSSAAISQNLFPKKFEGCNTDHFSLESNIITAKLEKSDILKVIKDALGTKTLSKIKGEMMLQIIVDLEGRSCLISIDNNTNINLDKLQLKEAIDNNLVWDKPSKKVAAIVALNFRKDEILIARMGLDGNKGWHRLEE